MKSINFLPWREQLIRKSRRRFVVVIGICLLFIVGASFLFYMNLRNKINLQAMNNKKIQQTINNLRTQDNNLLEANKKYNLLLRDINTTDAYRHNNQKLIKILQLLQTACDDRCKLIFMDWDKNSLILKFFIKDRLIQNKINKVLSRADFLHKPNISLSVDSNKITQIILRYSLDDKK